VRSLSGLSTSSQEWFSTWCNTMPFVRRDIATPPQDSAAEHDLASQIAALSSPSEEARWSAARALGGRAEAVAALAAALEAEQVPRVREAIMTALIRVGGAASVAALLPCLRSADAGLRAAATEALQALPHVTSPFLAALLGDSDSDVRILATELVRCMPAAEATHLLCGLLEHESHPNVCAAAVDVLAEVGTQEAIPALQACARRFAGTPFLPFAVTTAIARISGAEG
jgi:HEAT repeat protein